MQTLRFIYGMLLILIPFTMMAQNVKLSFENAVMTSDGTNDFYEADVMIASQTAAGSFYLSSGQVYLNYNEQAFGANISNSSIVAVTFPDNNYLLNLKDDVTGSIKIYTDAMTNDNTENRFSVAWQQDRAGNCITQMVTSTAIPLFHLKVKYQSGGTNFSPDICFETGNLFVGQIYTACGEMSGGCSLQNANCSSFPGIVVPDAFDCSGSSLCADVTVDAGNVITACQGELIVLGGQPTAGGGSGTYTYEWYPTIGLSDPTAANPEVTVTNNANYTVNVSDGSGCQRNATVVITANALPEMMVAITPATDANTADGSIDLQISGGTAPYTIVWTDGATTEDRENLMPGIYDAEITDANGCSISVSAVVGTDVASGVVDLDSWIQSVTMYPNPVYSDLNMSLTSTKNSPVVFQVVDDLGRVLLEKENNIHQGVNTFTLDTQSLANGNYFLQIMEGNADPVFVKTFVKLGK